MKIVIIGGGFCGSLCAKKLERDFDVTLIDNKEYFEFTPSVPHVLLDYDYRAKIQICHTSYLNKAKIIVSNADYIGADYVRINGRKTPYDYIIVSTGSTYNVPFKSSLVSILSRSKDLLEIHNKIEKENEILVVGGGVVGVEVAAELVTKTNKKIKLVHPYERLMQRYPEKVSDYATKFLEKRECKVILNERIKNNKKGTFFTDTGKINADLALLCTGVIPNFNFESEIKANKKGFLNVDENLKISNRIYAGGDTINLKEEKTAQNAREHAKIICKNIKREIEGRRLLKYKERESPMVISLGDKCGIFFYKTFVLTGFIPGLMKKTIEKRFIFEYKYL